MKYDDLKCEFCDGHGERERFVEPYGDAPVTCSFCNGTGIDDAQLQILINSKRCDSCKVDKIINDQGYCNVCGTKTKI
jgi:DnaJ-class molecular chaperone